MHEWALAESVVASVLGFADKKGIKSVKEIRLLFGEMQDIDKDVFRFAIKEMAKKKPIFSKLKVKIKAEKTRLQCMSCRNEWDFSFTRGLGKDEREAIHFLPEVSHVHVRCPKCKSKDFRIMKGRGIVVKSIVGE